ncbi:MAG TPA: hypothetical protein VIH57_12270, partial [Bacteroidales bacterium]
KYIALFNAQSKGDTADFPNTGNTASQKMNDSVKNDTTDIPVANDVRINFNTIGIKGKARVRDLWSHTNLGVFEGEFSRTLRQHAAGLYRISPVR